MPESSHILDPHSLETKGHFLPVRKEKLLEMIIEDPELAVGTEPEFRRISGMLEAWFHQDFHGTQEKMKSAFAHFDEEVNERWGESTQAEQDQAAKMLSGELDQLLVRANFERIDFDKLDPTHLRESIQKIALKIHLDDFEELVIYRRGLTTCTESIPHWFGLRSKDIQVPGFDRVCFFLRFKDQAYFDSKKRKNLPFTPGSISLKLFRNIPSVDLGTLFPNAEVRMRLTDRLLVGVPAAAGIIHFLFFKVGLAALGSIFAALMFITSLSDEEPNTKKLITAAVSLGVFGGFLLRKFNQFRNRKIYFLKVLSENLYFRNLDNDAGVFLHLLDSAEEAEVKEAILAYAFLSASKTPMLKAELDRQVEVWLRERLNKDVDFEVEDALGKLIELELVHVSPEGLHSALPASKVISHLCQLWDQLYEPQTG